MLKFLVLVILFGKEFHCLGAVNIKDLSLEHIENVEYGPCLTVSHVSL